jgi:hypothetical protein
VAWNHTFGAERAYRSANTLSIEDEQGVDRFPIFVRKNATKDEFGVIWVFGREPADAITNTMDMGVNADAVFLEGFDEDEVCGLTANTGEGKKLFEGLGYTTAVFFHENCGDFPETQSLRLVKSSGIDELL